MHYFNSTNRYIIYEVTNNEDGIIYCRNYKRTPLHTEYGIINSSSGKMYAGVEPYYKVGKYCVIMKKGEKYGNDRFGLLDIETDSIIVDTVYTKIIYFPEYKDGDLFLLIGDNYVILFNLHNNKRCRFEISGIIVSVEYIDDTIFMIEHLPNDKNGIIIIKTDGSLIYQDKWGKSFEEFKWDEFFKKEPNITVPYQIIQNGNRLGMKDANGTIFIPIQYKLILQFRPLLTILSKGITVYNDSEMKQYIIF